VGQEFGAIGALSLYARLGQTKNKSLFVIIYRDTYEYFAAIVGF
jgi:hypothetical protein